MTRLLIRFAACLCILLDLATARAQPDDAFVLPPAAMNEAVLFIAGDPTRPAMLEVTLFKPNGPGPFPLAVVNHGSSASGRPEDEPRHRVDYSADYFLSRGFAVALPMMRGFAGSGGTLQPHGCDALGAGLDNARDIRAVMSVLIKRPDVDAGHIIVAGQSFGGWNTLALGILDPPGVKGLVNFNGGERESDCAQQDESLIRVSRYLGGHTSLRSIWFYGDNDSIFPRSTWQAMQAEYLRAGGKVELVAFGAFMSDSHQLLSREEGLPMWVPKLDAFLASVGLPSKAAHPEYLPIRFPKPSHFAAISNVDAIPYVSQAGRDEYRGFLGRPFPRAFAIAPNGAAASAATGFDPLARALVACRQRATGCKLYAVDDTVVWTGRKAAPATRRTQRRRPDGITVPTDGIAR